MLGATAMHNEGQEPSEDKRTKALLERIKQLGDKSTQVLIFLSFAFLAVIGLESQEIAGVHEHSLRWSMRFWSWAVLFILLGVLPVRDAVDYAKNKVWWYECIRWIKVALLTVAVVLIFIGAACFISAIWHVGHSRAPGLL